MKNVSVIVCEKGSTNEYHNKELSNDSLVFRAYAGRTEAAYYTLILNKKSRKRVYLNTHIGEFKADSCDECPKFDFIDEISDSMLTQLDGVLGFNLGEGKDGYLLWFNIDDRPKYCYQLEREENLMKNVSND